MFKKNNSGNKGFSLVELLVAITILGLASGMVLHAFTTATNITARTKAFGEATAAADNVAEAVYAYSKDYTYPDDVKSNYTVGNAVPVTLGDTALSMLGADNIYKLAPDQFDNPEIQSGVAVTGVNVGGNKFDAKITWSPGNKEAAPDTDEYGIYELNNYDMAQYTEMDGSFTQSYRDSENPDVLSDLEFYDEARTSAYTLDASGNPKYKAKTRLISVNIIADINASTGKPSSMYMEVIYNYTYTYEAKKIVDNIDLGVKDDVDHIYVTAPDSFVYNVTFSEKDADGNVIGTTNKFVPTTDHPEPTVFIMYYPDYNAKKYGSYKRYSNYDMEDSSKPSDYIDLIHNNALEYRDYNTTGGVFRGKDVVVINNLYNVETKFFVIKQRQVYTQNDVSLGLCTIHDVGDPVTDAYLTSRGLENVSYRACIAQRFTVQSRLGDNTKNKIYTNAGINLTNGTKIAGFTGYKVVGGWGDNVEYSGLALDEANDVDKFVSKRFVTTAKNGRYYLVTVDVYKEGTLVDTTPTATITDGTGSVIDSYYAISEDATPIYSFSGSNLK